MTAEGGPVEVDRLTVRCACGWETRGSEDEVVAATRSHGELRHNMTATREEILAMADRGKPPGAVRNRDEQRP